MPPMQRLPGDPNPTSKERKSAALPRGNTVMKAEWKIRSYTSEEIAQITGGILVPGTAGSCPVTGICTDSREVVPGMLFCAIAGERTDGHLYIDTACGAGAACVLAQRAAENCPVDTVVVPDTVRAIGDLAGYYRDQSSIRVIAITGSVGKTTTKEFIAAVASAGYRTHKTEGNHNNDLGLSMTLFTLSPEDQVSVLEMGMSNAGEIARLSELAKPDVAVITNIGTSHMESLGSRENICRAKLEIVTGMREGGILLYNGDEPLLVDGASAAFSSLRSFSVDGRDGHYRAVNIRQTGDGMLYDLISDDKVLTNVRIPTLGRHNVYNSLAAYAVGDLLGLDEDTIRRGLLAFHGADRRQKIYEIGDITVIDDCYNASPESMRAALDVLTAVAASKGQRATALLGDMLELGEYSRLMHDQVGQYAAEKRVSHLFCYGKMADVVAEAAIKHGIRADNVCVSLDTKDPATMADMILSAIQPGDVLLVKASRGVAAENVIECLKSHFERQEKK